MNWTEAIEQLKLGKVLSHPEFSPPEYINLVEGKLITEDGFAMRQEDYFEMRTNRHPQYKDGWYILEEGEYIPMNEASIIFDYYNMTRGEAIQSMREGNKVTHRYFGEKEWIRLEGNKLFDEQGYHAWLKEFMKIRDNAAWEIDWMLYPTQ